MKMLKLKPRFEMSALPLLGLLEVGLRLSRPYLREQSEDPRSLALDRPLAVCQAPQLQRSHPPTNDCGEIVT